MERDERRHLGTKMTDFTEECKHLGKVTVLGTKGGFI